MRYGGFACLLLTASALLAQKATSGVPKSPGSVSERRIAAGFGELLTHNLGAEHFAVYDGPAGTTDLLLVNEAGWYRLAVPVVELEKWLFRIDQRWISPPFLSRVIDSDRWLDAVRGQDLIATLADSGQVEIWDAAQGLVLSSFHGSPGGYLRSLAFAQADGDAAPEVVVLSEQAMAVFDVDGQWLWGLEDVGGFDLAVGQLDDDPAQEIAMSGGAIVDCETRQVQAEMDGPYAFRLTLGDVDHDGAAEIFATASDRFVRVFDGASGALRAEVVGGSYRIADILYLERNGEGYLATGDRNGATVALRRLADGAVIWQINVTGGGIRGLKVADLDGDGVKELLWVSGIDTSGLNFFEGADLWTGDKHRIAETFFGAFVGPDRGDFDGDGRTEIAAVAKISAFGSRILVFDSYQARLREVSGIHGPFVYSPLDTRVADLDGDGRDEILVAAGGQSWGRVAAFGRDAHGQWNEELVAGVDADGPFHSLAVSDLNGDGAPDIVAEGRIEYLRPPKVVAFDGRTGAELWRVELDPIPLNPHESDIEILDLDRDGTPEVIVLIRSSVAGDVLFVIDSATREIEARLPGVWACLSRRIAVDLDDERASFWTIDSQGLARYEWSDGGLVPTYRDPSVGYAVSIVEAGPDLWLAGGSVTQYRWTAGSVVWRSDQLGIGGRGSGVAPPSVRGGPVVGGGGSSLRWLLPRAAGPKAEPSGIR